jgi:uncharacterized membrane protein YqjE
MATPQRSFPDVLQNIITNVQEIIRYEFRLAETEISEKAAQAAGPAVTFGIGLALAFYGVGFLLLACVSALSAIIAAWLAALLVGAVVSIVALALVSSSGKKLKNMNYTPQKTIRSLEQEGPWPNHQMNSNDTYGKSGTI